MKNISALYTNSFDPERLKVYNSLSYFSDKFTLAGGTAIMLQIGHRKSFDFDCFSKRPLDASLLTKINRVFGNNINLQVNTSQMLLLTTVGGVKIDFVYFPYKHISSIVRSKPISMFSLQDLAANKAYVIGRRATWRDYVDILFLTQIFNLDEIIIFAKKKFGGEFSEKLFLEQLVYFDDIDIFPIDYLHKSYTDNEIKDKLKKIVTDYSQNILVADHVLQK